jgi:hypothetical protein
VEALCYKPEGRGFNSRCSHLTFFHYGLIQPLTETSTRNFAGGGGGKARPTRKADNLTAICDLIVYKNVIPGRHTTLLSPTASFEVRRLQFINILLEFIFHFFVRLFIEGTGCGN